MTSEWDDAKNAANIKKHRVSFLTARQVWRDPFHVVSSDRVQDGEQRWHALGMIGPVVVLVVVHTYPDPGDDRRIRIISARKATKVERRSYERQDT